MPENSPIIVLSQVAFAYDRQPILTNIDLTIHHRDFIGIIGPNGSGKTTLLKLILGLMQPDSGTIRINGQPPEKARHDIGYVPQFANFARDFPVSVLDVVMMGLLGQATKFGPFRKEERDQARNTLETVGASDFEKRRIGRLSGGQLQRVLLARALVNQPDILLLDEPTSNIDARAEESFFDLLHRLNQQITIMLVSHDLGFITTHVNRVACVNRTLVCHPTAEITSDVIASLYETPVGIIKHHHTVD